MYRIPEHYRSAAPFYGTDLLDFEAGKKLIEIESLLFEKAQEKIPKYLGEILQNFYEDEKFMLGIHRTPKSLDEIVNSYFVKGLENKKLEYDNTISTYLYFPELLHEILKCNSSWKKSKGCLIIRIPKEPGAPFYRVVVEDKKEKYYVLPSFIYGYVEVENEKIINFVYNTNYGKNLPTNEKIVSDIYIERKAKLKSSWHI